MDDKIMKEYASMFGRMGGLATKKKMPKDYFSKLGKRANKVRWGKKAK